MTTTLNAGQRLRQKLGKGEATFGLWITLECPIITEIAVHAGLDWVCIDTEHGHLDFKELAGHLSAMNRSSTAALVRVPEIGPSVIKRILGLGAHGILIPLIRTAEEVERAVHFAKYPPQGCRGMGIEPATVWGQGLGRTKIANQETMVIPMIETVDAGKNIDSILEVPGVDAFFFGPADYSASAGYLGEWEGPGIAAELLRIKDRIRARGLACGIMATSDASGPSDGTERIAQGFQMIGIGCDCDFLVNGITRMMAAMGRAVDPQVWTVAAR